MNGDAFDTETLRALWLSIELSPLDRKDVERVLLLNLMGESEAWVAQRFHPKVRS
jgi:hypothetical protein